MSAPIETVIPDDEASLLAVAAQNPEVDLEILKSVPKKFCIDSEAAANWLVRRVLESRAYADHVRDFGQRELHRAHREEATLMFLFGRQIERWTKDEIEKFKGRRKSLVLPAGVVGFRRQASRLVIDDDLAVMGWARKNLPDAIQTVEKLVRSIVTDNFVNTGEMPDVGVHIEAEKEVFSIK
jgi:hypothetical protein